MKPSRRPLGSIAAACGVAICAAILYSRHLDVSPPAGTELAVTREASAVVAQGSRDAEGRWYPVFWHGSADQWLAPLPVYGSAVALRLVDSATGPRIATAIGGALGVLLFYVLVVRVFQSVGLAVVAAALLLLSPAYVTFSRSATHDGMWVVPFVVAWLLALTTALTRTRDGSLIPTSLCAMVLVAGVYSQPSGALTTVLLGGVTVAALWPTRHWTRRTLAVAAATAAAMSLPLGLWLARYPSTYPDTLGQWLLHPAHIRNPLEWAQSLTNWNTLSLVSKAYWDFFSPSHLFLSDTSPALAGVFVLPVGVLVAFGIRSVLRDDRTGVDRVATRLALFAFMGLPLVAAAFREPRAIDRALAIVPMGILLAASGTQFFWQSGSRNRAIVVLLVAAAITQSLAWYVGIVG